MKNTFLFLAIFFTLVSCDCTYQYDVLVRNETGSSIEVKYKTKMDVRGEVEETVTLKSGEQKRIISTKDIDAGQGCTGIEKTHYELVAEYIKAFKNNEESKKEWSAEEVKLENVDIQQGEFIMTYTENDW